MNYELWRTGDGGDVPDSVIGVIFRDPWQRPTVGQEITIKGKNRMQGGIVERL